MDSISIYDTLRKNNAFTEKQAKAQVKIMQNLATKDDLKEFATKGDLKRFATKDDLKEFATKDDLKKFATKEDLKKFATKDDLKNFATKDDIKNMATKDDLVILKNEMQTEITAQISSLKSALLIWLPALALSQPIVLITLMKLFLTGT